MMATNMHGDSDGLMLQAEVAFSNTLSNIFILMVVTYPDTPACLLIHLHSLDVSLKPPQNPNIPYHYHFLLAANTYPLSEIHAEFFLGRGGGDTLMEACPTIKLVW